MRELTLKGYLAKYVRALSGENTLNIRALAKEAVNDDPRLMVPLLLYAVYHGKLNCCAGASLKTTAAKRS